MLPVAWLGLAVNFLNRLRDRMRMELPETLVYCSGRMTETWEVEAHALPILRRLGMTSDTMRVGDEVTIRGPRSRLDWRPDGISMATARISLPARKRNWSSVTR